MSKILKKSALKAPANGQLITYSKIQPRVSKSTLIHTCGLILDQISQTRVPPKLPQMCQENGTFALNALSDAPSVSHPPQKWYHHIA